MRDLPGVWQKHPFERGIITHAEKAHIRLVPTLTAKICDIINANVPPLSRG